MIAACAMPSDLSMVEINEELLKLQEDTIEDDKQPLKK